jgi:hypothetical protein
LREIESWFDFSAMPAAVGEMIRELVEKLGLGLAFAMISITAGQTAGKITYDDILGKWCGVSSNPNWTNMLFARDTLKITQLPAKTIKVFKVDQYEFTDTSVLVNFLAAGDPLAPTPAGKEVFQATYSDFSSDGKTMSQSAIPGRGAYHFKRCS